MTSKQKLSAPQQRAVDAIEKHGASSDADLAADLNTSPSNVNRTLAALVKNGVIVKVDGKFALPADEIVEETKGGEQTPEQQEAATASDVEETTPARVQGIGDGVSDDALSKAQALRDAESEFKLTPSGSGAKMVTVSNREYLTTDGRFVTVKDERDVKAPWSLFEVTKKGPKAAGQFKTCTAAFGEEGVLAKRDA